MTASLKVICPSASLSLQACDFEPKAMMLNPDQCRAKATECLEAAQRARYVDQRRLYEEIAAQWMLVAQRVEQSASKLSGNGSATKHVE
jgi:hypothetical protein